MFLNKPLSYVLPLGGIFIAALTVFVVTTEATTLPASDKVQPSASADAWSPPRPGDACSKHKNTAHCKADTRCYGMPYKGESVVACIYDLRGFSTNCPTVGCTDQPPSLPDAKSNN